MLEDCNVPPQLAQEIAFLVALVSFTNEISNSDNGKYVARMCEEIPELRIFQDADRLDGLGSLGQARCFVYGGASEKRRGQSLHVGVQLLRLRFQRYLPLMKTKTGHEEAEKRLAEMKRLVDEYNEESDVSSVT
jgi:uncharacterized protein